MLTPLDIESKIFSKSLSGYNVQEVKQFMKDLLVNYEKMYRENIELKDKVNLLNEGIQYYKTIEETLQNTLILAEKTAEETKALARSRAEQIIKESELRADTLMSDAKNQIYSINREKEAMIRAYDASKIQMRQFLKAQLELTDRNSLEFDRNAYSDEDNNQSTGQNDIQIQDDLEDDLGVVEME